MTPVINPWIFYAMDALDSFKILCMIVLFATVAFYIMYIPCLELDLDMIGFNKFMRKVIKPAIAVVVIAILGIIFIPSQDTMIKMLVAQNVTYERIEDSTDVVERVYTDIMELLDDGKDAEGG